ncbi:uncharacterized protein LOC125959693 [Anopheles darlingi]|uniref:uncharacterized protein LOC125959693 n=1 Tax=Anopheles darlingi TaxID=43151 RepID=UPI0020FFFA31|nr:uncharacterized protein LOC125959693 [Anopheles darlingi]
MAIQCIFGTKFRVSMTFIVITCLCLEHVKGSCLSYGHSCWGAHGKRAGPPRRAASSDIGDGLPFRPHQPPELPINLPVALTPAARWALVRMIPDKNTYYPFNKLIPLMDEQFLFGNDLVTGESDSPPASSDIHSSGALRSSDASNESKPPLTSTEMEHSLDDAFTVPTKLVSSTNNGHRREHRRKKKPLSVPTNLSRYGIIDDKSEDAGNIDRILTASDEDIGQLLFDATAAAVAVVPDSDAAGQPFTHKLFSAPNSGAPYST